MPARVVVVHDDREFVGELEAILRRDGHEPAIFPDPLKAWSALEAATQTEVLVTRAEFAPGRSNGIALAAMARSKRPQICVIFAAREEYANAVEGMGIFMPLPVAPQAVADEINRLLRTTTL